MKLVIPGGIEIVIVTYYNLRGAIPPGLPLLFCLGFVVKIDINTELEE